MDVGHAGMLAACYSIPASLFRVVGGWMSDRMGARRVMYWTFGVSAICTFLLAYPDTEYVVKGIHGPIHFHLAI
ncbi:MFS transporter, partial [Acinetobacter baumannii]